MRLLSLVWLLAIFSLSVEGKETPAAVIYGKPISYQAITPNSEELEEMGLVRQMPKYRFYLAQVRTGRLIKTLLDEATAKFATERGIEKGKDKALIESVINTFYPEEETISEEQQMNAEEIVYRWQIDKALYEEFGGTVVFQQSNPVAPIESYRLLLQRELNGGALELVDEQLATMVWESMGPPYRLVVEPENVKFDIPWWQSTQ